MIKNKLKKRLLQELSYATGKYLISPEIVSLVITYKCNFRCRACTVWRMDRYPELSLEKWGKVIAQFPLALSKGTSIELSGGEPLLRKDLAYFLISRLSKYFENVGINSNGSLLNEETIAKLKESGIDFVKISLYSLGDSAHDELRGVSGAAQQAKRAIDSLEKQQIKTDVGILITSQNISDIPAIIEHYSHSKYKNVSLILQPLDEPIGLEPITGKDKIATIENLWPDEKSIRELFSWIRKNNSTNIKNSQASLLAIEKYYLDQKSALNRRCFAGQRSLVIYPDGNISLCYKGTVVGNTTKENLQNILSSKRSSEERRKIRNCSDCCRIIGCNFSKTIPEIFTSL
jgi:MoaA/NifB/PqqE/SkfB family radical SAM enzyme